MRSVLSCRLCMYLAVVVGSLFATHSSRAGNVTPEPQWLPSETTMNRWQVFPLLLQEANRVAAELHLPERLPITENDILETFIAPPRFARDYQALGNVSTSNYLYCISRGNKFSYLIGKHQQEDCLKWEKEYLWPLSRIDTNGAYQLATQYLTAVSIDVHALNRDHRLHIEPDKIYVRAPKDKFVPVYWVGWYKPFKQDPDTIVSAPGQWEPVASVFLCLPTKTLLQLRVEDPKYILRKPLDIDPPLSQTNAVRQTNGANRR